MSSEQWDRASHVLDYILAQPTGKPVKENPAIYGVRGMPEKPPRKPRKGKEHPPEQLRLF